MATPRTKTSTWLIWFSAIVIGVVVSMAGCVMFGASPVLIAVAWGLIGLCIGFNWLINSAWDRWRKR